MARTIAQSVNLLDSTLSQFRLAVQKHRATNSKVDYGMTKYSNYKLSELPPVVKTLEPPATYLTETALHNAIGNSTASQIETISFASTGPINESNYYTTDLSRDKDGSIIGYLEGTTYTITSRGRRMIFPKSLSQWFYDMSNLKSINSSINLIDVSNVENMDNMFYGCTRLNDINNFFERFTACHPTSMDGTFIGCSNLKTVNLSYLNLSSCKDFTNTFTNCSSLTDVNFGFNRISSATSTTYMFSGCTSLKSINLNYLIDPFYGVKLSSCDGMFRGCTSLKRIYTDRRWDGISGLNGTNMFQNCTSLPGYSSSKTDLAYAKSTSSGGYFTPYTT